jgi:uncharacterized membrane protein YidH (DUF202 family)
LVKVLQYVILNQYHFNFKIILVNLPISLSSTSKWVETFARFGLSAKGFVYVLSGLLTFMAAFGLGNMQESDGSNNGIFSFISEKPYGKVLLAIVALGLVCYAAWRFIEAIKDTENKGSDTKGIAKRTTYFLSGLGYASLAFVAIKFILSDNKGGGNSQEKLAAELLSKPFGQWLVAIVAAIVIGIGLWQAYLALSGKFKKHVEKGGVSAKVLGLVLRAGKVGYISRGIVWIIIGWLFIKAAWNKDARQAGGTQNAFQWLKDSSYGAYLLATIAAGLMCYGIFMFVRARHQPIGKS